MGHRKQSRLGRVGVLAPAALSACVDASVLAVPAAGAVVSTVLHDLSKAFMLKKWFHGNLSAKEAEQLMMERGRNGSYLVRESRTSPGDLVLSVRVRGRVSHVIIRKQRNKYEVGGGTGEQFEDLAGLIEYYRAYPIVESCGDVLRLRQPLGSIVRSTFHVTPSAELVPDNDKEYSEEVLDRIDVDWEWMEWLDGISGQFPTEEGKKKENLIKNRYHNIVPYDHTRVVLKQKRPDAESGADYINANYICLDTSTLCVDPLTSTPTSDSKGSHDHNLKYKTYIATQGCLPDTENDFYRMLYQEEVLVVVMLTKEQEHKKIKCSTYWPSSVGETKHMPDFSVQLISEVRHKEYIRRQMDIRNIEDERYHKITQFQFIDWLDHTTPNVEAVLNLVHDMNVALNEAQANKEHANKEHANTQNGAVCVHCSAGVGRTGTFIALDFLIRQLHNLGERFKPDIRQVVWELRRQRRGLVQNRAQFAFLHTALQIYINRHTEAVSASSKSSDIDLTLETKH